MFFLTCYRAFINLLKAEGSLHVMSEPMRKLLNIMPEEARILVKKEGGLRDFLEKSSLFTVEADIVTNFEEKFMTDLSTKPYKKPQDLPIITAKENGIGRLEEIPRPDSSDFNTVRGKYGPVGSLPAKVGETLLENNSLGNDDILQGNKSLPDADDALQLNNNSKIDLHLPEFSAVKNPDNFASVNSENVGNIAMTDAWSKQESLERWASVKEFVPLSKDVNNVNSGEISNKGQSVATGHNGFEGMAEKSTSVMGAEPRRKIADNIVNNVDKEITDNIDKILSEDSYDDVHGLVSELTDKVAENHESVMKIKENMSDISSSATKTASNTVAIVEPSVLKKEAVGINTMNTGTSALVLSEQAGPITQDENNKVTPNPIPNSAIKDSSVLVEPKFTKEKGVQSKPNTKNKIIMTEAMNEPYKAEYEKSLRSCQGWETKYQELLDKNNQLEKKYNFDVANLEKKLLECGHKNELEKREKNEKIKKLQEQLMSMSKSEEK